MSKTKKPLSVKDSDENVVLQYLRKTNRPYNATDVHTNLNGTLTKASVTKALDKLADKQLAISKAYGKTVIYSIKQDEEEHISAEDMANLDGQIEKLAEKLKSLKEINMEKTSELKKLKSTLPTSEAQEQLLQLRSQNDATNDRLAHLRNDKEQVTSTEKLRIEKEYDTNIKLWRSRKKLDELGIDEDPASIESVLVD